MNASPSIADRQLAVESPVALDVAAFERKHVRQGYSAEFDLERRLVAARCRSRIRSAVKRPPNTDPPKITQPRETVWPPRHPSDTSVSGKPISI